MFLSGIIVWTGIFAGGAGQNSSVFHSNELGDARDVDVLEASKAAAGSRRDEA